MLGQDKGRLRLFRNSGELESQGFATGTISLGELEVAIVKDFEFISSYTPKTSKTSGVTFYKPVSILDGFFTFGHYCQPTDKQLRGYVIVARDTQNTDAQPPPLKSPLGYDLIWSSNSVYVWKPISANGYRALGFVVTIDADEPDLEEVRCVRDDLTENCLIDDDILNTSSNLQVWNTKTI
ncbi:hypothetical protein LXL04_028954 [Taraxacum kok-saghyz]